MCPTLDTVQRFRAALLSCQAAHLTLSTRLARTADATAGAIQCLADAGFASGYQHRDHFAGTGTRAVAPQGGKGQSFDSGQCVHVAHDHVSEASCQ